MIRSGWRRCPDESRPLRFPLVGKIAAGYPIERVSQEDELDVANLFASKTGNAASSTFALKVEGDSMRDEGILDGDYILIERRDTASNGDRVVALLPDGAVDLLCLALRTMREGLDRSLETDPAQGGRPAAPRRAAKRVR